VKKAFIHHLVFIVAGIKMSSAELDEGLGNVTWWGFSPAINLEKGEKEIYAFVVSESLKIAVYRITVGFRTHKVHESVANMINKVQKPAFLILSYNLSINCSYN
jgi:hypothetical protein